MESINKSTKVVFACCISFIIAFLIFMSIQGLFEKFPERDIILKEAQTLQFKGRVDSIYRDKTNHNAETLILSDGTKYGVYSDWETLVSVGDSLEKKNSQLLVRLSKKSGQIVILDYHKLTQLLNHH